jgi:hypothetical protein
LSLNRAEKHGPQGRGYNGNEKSATAGETVADNLQENADRGFP